MIAAAQLDDVAIRIADEDRDLLAFAEADRSLRDRDVVRLQSANHGRNGGDAQRHVRIARRGVRLTCIGVEDQIQLDSVFIANDRELVAFGLMYKLESQSR
ncbi:MAG TPA: hypothetical protein VME69_11460 [Methylocella sp.]|nr:hypothetical protein [Methylocella sp.]